MKKEILLSTKNINLISELDWKEDFSEDSLSLEELVLLYKDKYRYLVYLPEDCILPLNFKNNLNDLIKQANIQFNKNWGIISPKGSLFSPSQDERDFTKRFKEFDFTRYENDFSGIHFNTKSLFLGIIDTNAPLLINLEALSSYKNDGTTILEYCYSNCLATAISSNLYNARLELKNNNENSISSELIKLYLGYLKSYFESKNLIIHIIARTTGFDDVAKVKKRLDSIHNLARSTNKNVFINLHYAFSKIKQETIDVILENSLDTSLNNFGVTYSNYKIDLKDTRVDVIRESLKDLKGKKGFESYVIFVDYDDYVDNYDFINQLGGFLEKDRLLIGVSKAYKGDKLVNVFQPEDFFKNLMGGNHIPFCSVIFPLDALKNVFKKLEFKATYFEDYAITLALMLDLNVLDLPISLCRINYYEENTVLRKDRYKWLQSEITFIDEIVSKFDISQISFSLLNSLGKDSKKVKNWARAISEFNELEEYKASNDMKFIEGNNLNDKEIFDGISDFTRAIRMDEKRTNILRAVITDGMLSRRSIFDSLKKIIKK